MGLIFCYREPEPIREQPLPRGVPQVQQLRDEPLRAEPEASTQVQESGAQNLLLGMAYRYYTIRQLLFRDQYSFFESFEDNAAQE